MPDVIVGVDTHAEMHVAVAIDGQGRVLDATVVTARRSGYGRLVRWARSLGRIDRFGIEAPATGAEA